MTPPASISPSTATTRALVLGASGQIGHFLLPELVAQGVSVEAVSRDAQPAQGSLDRFSHQIEHDAQMESDTRVPSVESLVGENRS